MIFITELQRYKFFLHSQRLILATITSSITTTITFAFVFLNTTYQETTDLIFTNFTYPHIFKQT